MRHKTVFRVHCPVPGPSRSDPPGVLPGKVDKICGGHGQGETPGPIPNPEAKALHGDGTAPERVWESSAPPLSHDTVPPGRAPTGSRGVPLFPPRTHARAGRTTQPRIPRGRAIPSSYLYIYSSIRSSFPAPVLLFIPSFLPSFLLLFPPPFLSLVPLFPDLSRLPPPSSRHLPVILPAPSPLSFSCRISSFPFLPGDSRIPVFCLFRSSSAIIGFWNSL